MNCAADISVNCFFLKEVEIRYKDFPALPALSGPVSLCSFLVEFIGPCSEERFVAVFLDSEGGALGVMTVGVGAPALGMVEPKAVFRGALMVNASGLVAARSFPDGKCVPGWKDWDLFRRLREVGDVCGVEVVDYVLVCGAEWVCLGE
ncbi:MAG: hypothetical protein GY754_31495 [bacterium]|nr:hypothetical protein [bacterium]